MTVQERLQERVDAELALLAAFSSLFLRQQPKLVQLNDSLTDVVRTRALQFVPLGRLGERQVEYELEDAHDLGHLAVAVAS